MSKQIELVWIVEELNFKLTKAMTYRFNINLLVKHKLMFKENWVTRRKKTIVIQNWRRNLFPYEYIWF